MTDAHQIRRRIRQPFHIKEGSGRFNGDNMVDLRCKLGKALALAYLTARVFGELLLTDLLPPYRVHQLGVFLLTAATATVIPPHPYYYSDAPRSCVWACGPSRVRCPPVLYGWSQVR